MQIEMTLESALATKKATAKSVIPSRFQVSAKIDELVRKEDMRNLAFLITLVEPKNMVTYEFRGTCVVTGSATAFEHLIESHDGRSRLPRILDLIYQRVYPSVFLLAGMTSSPYPQSTTLGTDLTESTEENTPAAEAVADVLLPEKNNATTTSANSNTTASATPIEKQEESPLQPGQKN
jgi:hypothetical protein